MSGLKIIRRRLSSVKNTKQITRAMKLVSAAKLKRAQDAALGGRKFSNRLDEVLLAAISQLPSEFNHPLIESRPIKRRAYVLFAGERGLCGAYNTNVGKACIASVNNGAEVEPVFFVVGRRAEALAKRSSWTVQESLVGLPEDPSQWPLNELGASLVSMFETKVVDEIVLIYTKFVSAMSLVVTEEVLLPFSVSSGVVNEAVGDSATGLAGNVKVEPSAPEVFSSVLPLVLKTKLFQAAYESKACEHAARMTAMDSATRNADELIGKLLLFYNRARQRAITSELMDILGGAEAQKN
ncbi:MAG TPA: ATP synthase F1 subunit gamma [Oligoflexia bacterium]|nr:ATP synthase F1 subunit gamma [Oligoflexia bacterium]HMP48163.1 ATP synthase F1 subunit gamma [Oligoflexia bacterium]